MTSRARKLREYGLHRRGKEECEGSRFVVEVPWGFEFSVRGTVHEVYGFDDDLRVVVLVTPELSGQVVDEPTTVVWPISRVKRITPVS